MITMIDVCRRFGRGTTCKVILDHADLRVETRDRVGILSATGAGKTTIARLLSGHVLPNSGSIIRTASLSWPIGFASALHPHLSAAENVHLVAGLYNLEPYALSVHVETFAELGRAYLDPVSSLAPGLRAQLALGLSLSVDFDMYLADELSASGSKQFQNKCEAAIHDKLQKAGLILLTRHTHTIERYCNRFVVLAGARFIECEDARQARETLQLSQQEVDPIHAKL